MTASDKPMFYQWADWFSACHDRWSISQLRLEGLYLQLERITVIKGRILSWIIGMYRIIVWVVCSMRWRNWAGRQNRWMLCKRVSWWISSMRCEPCPSKMRRIGFPDVFFCCCLWDEASLKLLCAEKLVSPAIGWYWNTTLGKQWVLQASTIMLQLTWFQDQLPAIPCGTAFQGTRTLA
jgi:hypothetical protein